jgi:hypothetical protein
MLFYILDKPNYGLTFDPIRTKSNFSNLRPIAINNRPMETIELKTAR